MIYYTYFVKYGISRILRFCHSMGMALINQLQSQKSLIMLCRDMKRCSGNNMTGCGINVNYTGLYIYENIIGFPIFLAGNISC